MSQGRQKNQDCQNEFRQTSNDQIFFSKQFRQRKLSTIIKLGQNPPLKCCKPLKIFADFQRGLDVSMLKI